MARSHSPGPLFSCATKAGFRGFLCEHWQCRCWVNVLSKRGGVDCVTSLRLALSIAAVAQYDAMTIVMRSSSIFCFSELTTSLCSTALLRLQRPRCLQPFATVTLCAILTRLNRHTHGASFSVTRRPTQKAEHTTFRTYKLARPAQTSLKRAFGYGTTTQAPCMLQVCRKRLRKTSV